MRNRRLPAVAGRFYPAEERRCRDEVAALLAEHAVAAPESDAVPVGGIVPHAGWMFSGRVAAHVLCEIAAQRTPATVVVFGADHWLEASRHAQVYPEGAWSTPLGDVPIDAALGARVVELGRGAIQARADAHRREHSIEVQIPLIQALWPAASVLPILVGPGAEPALVGRAVAEAAADRDDVLALGSTDLTHYGPSYDFTSHGRGRAALAWVRDVNDAAMVAAATAMRGDEVLAEANRHANACGPGAVAAAIAFARARGAARGRLVEYTTSHDVHPRGEPSDFVGYAGVLFERAGGAVASDVRPSSHR